MNIKHKEPIRVYSLRNEDLVKKNFSNLYTFLDELGNTDKYIESKDLIKKIKINENAKNEFIKYCRTFLEHHSKIKFINENPLKGEILIYDNNKNENENDIDSNYNEQIEKECDYNNFVVDEKNFNEQPEIIELNNKSLEQLLDECFPEKIIDIKNLKEEFENNKYNEKYINIYKIINELLGECENVQLNFEGLFEIFSFYENIKKEFKNYLIVHFMKIFYEKYKLRLIDEKKQRLIQFCKEEELKKKEFFSKKNTFKYSIIKRIDYSKDNKIITVLFEKDLLYIQTDNKVCVYNIKNYQLITQYKYNFGNNILKLKSGDIIGKFINENYGFIINNKEVKKIFFSNSKMFKLLYEANSGDILMNRKKEIYIYRKMKNIYILYKIIKRKISEIYEINSYSLLFIGSDWTFYSINDYKLIKYRAYNSPFTPDICLIDEKLLLSCYPHFQYPTYYGAYLDLYDRKSLAIISHFYTEEKIQKVAYLNNKILTGCSNTYCLYEINLINNQKLFIKDITNIPGKIKNINNNIFICAGETIFICLIN